MTTLKWVSAVPPSRPNAGEGMSEREILDSLAEWHAQQEARAWAEVKSTTALTSDTFEDGSTWTQEELNKATAHGMRILFMGEDHK